MSGEPRVVMVGAGAIGSSIAGWVAPKYSNFSLLARGEALEAIKSHGLRSYSQGGRSTAEAVPVHAVGSLAEVASPDIIAIAVKNYDLEAACRELRAQLGNQEPIVVGLQNGVANQRVLPRYFARAIYGVICYNAWRDGPGEVGHEPRGYVILGTPANDLQEEAQTVARIFGCGMDCVTTDRLQDAAHCKLVINLANPLMTLVGLQKRPIGSFGLLMHMTLQLFREGVRLLQKAGFHEHPLGRVPSWRLIRMGASLPPFMTSALYRLDTKKLGLNSMAQDVFGGRPDTELEFLNGYMLELARRAGFSTPINETVYKVAKERFGPDFRPISEQELWAEIRKARRAKSSAGPVPQR